MPYVGKSIIKGDTNDEITGKYNTAIVFTDNIDTGAITK